MFGIGGNELVLIIIFGFILFGSDKLPAMAKTLGRAIARFRAAQKEMDAVIRSEVFDPDNPLDSSINALDALAKAGQQKPPAKQKVSADYLYGLSDDEKGE